MQELAAKYRWGYLWGCEGLPRKTRSMLNLATIRALSCPHELKGDLRSVPAGGDLSRRSPGVSISFRTAREVFAEIDKKK